MKIQDLIFVLVGVLLCLTRNPRYFVSTGLLCLMLSIPLYYYWVFFTAERLTWYALAFFSFSIVLYIRELRKV